MSEEVLANKNKLAWHAFAEFSTL